MPILHNYGADMAQAPHVRGPLFAAIAFRN